jgi:hypothetical protein
VSEEGEDLKQGRIIEGSAHLPASSSLTASGTVIRGSRSVGGQTWSIEYGQWQIEAADAEPKREEERKDNDLRRFCLRLLVILLVVVLVVSAGVGVLNEEPTTRQWAQNIVTTLIGDLLGAIAGYFTAKGGS